MEKVYSGERKAVFCSLGVKSGMKKEKVVDKEAPCGQPHLHICIFSHSAGTLALSHFSFN
jgi:hypothetical protein